MNKYLNELTTDSVGPWIVQKTRKDNMDNSVINFPDFLLVKIPKELVAQTLLPFSLATSPSPPPCGYSIRELGCYLGITKSYSLVTADWTRARHLTRAGPMGFFSRELEIGTKRGQAPVWLLSCQERDERLEAVANSNSLLHSLESRGSQSATIEGKKAEE